MDLITQGITGALFAQTVASKEQKHAATLVGFFAGLLPDADILIRSASDPLLNLEFHRQFSHALVFIPVGGLVAAILLWPFFRRKLSLSMLYLFSFLGYSMGGLLDACTSFGTQLLWPFSDERLAWYLISVIDPVFSLVLCVFLWLGWKKRDTRFGVMGFIFAGMYLSLSYNQQQAVIEQQKILAESRGHQIERSVVKPTLGNIVLWRSVYLSDQHYYVDGIRVSVLGGEVVYRGGSIPMLDVTSEFPHLSDVQRQDIDRFSILSQQFLVRHPKDHQVIGDIRYAMLPNSIEPLWGIQLDPEQPLKHVTERLFRKKDKATRSQFGFMLLGDERVGYE